MPRGIYELVGMLMVLASIVFFFYSVQFLSDRDYIGGILQIFVGFALIRAGLELTKIGLLKEERTS